MPEKTLILQEGEPFFIPFGCQYHSYWYPKNGEVSWHSLSFELLPFSNDKRPVLQKLVFNESAMRCFERIVSDYSRSISSIGALYTLLGELENDFEYKDNHIHPVAEAALALLSQNPFQNICQLARECGVSESSLYNIFKRSFGYSPNFARQKVLCEKAIHLLETTDLPVEEISERMGFSSSSYFRKVLRFHTGVTPRQIRKMAII